MPVLDRPNPAKNLEISADGAVWERRPVRTPVVGRGDDLPGIFAREAGEAARDGDLLCVAESVVAIAEGRAFPIDEIRPRPLARFLSRFVSKVPHGIGLGRPETMELALRECGVARILAATGIAAVTRLLGIRGMFYRVAGDRARAIDGPCDFKIPPFNKWASLGPGDPSKSAEKIAAKFLPKKISVAVVDANDIGTRTLGATDRGLFALGEKLTADNPMGQTDEATPGLLCRRAGTAG